MSTSVNTKPPTKRQREAADRRMDQLRQRRAELDRAERAFEKAAVAAYEGRAHYTATEVARAAGWSRPRLYQFLKGREAA